MKKIFSLLAAVLFAGSMMADSYTITFKEGSGTDSDSGTKVTTVADIISDGASYVSEIATATNVYNARVGRGIKLGTSKATGELTLTLAAPVQATSIVVTARKYNDSEKAFTIQGQEFTAGDGTDFAEYTYTYETATEISSIALASTKRIYFTSVTVNYGGEVVPPTPTMNYYVTGSMTNWAPNANYMLTPDNGGLYKGEFTFAANDEFKVTYSDGTTIDDANWFPTGMGNNYTITEAGDYAITFNPAGNVEGWYAGFFQVAKKEVPVVAPISLTQFITDKPATEVTLKDLTVIFANGKNTYVIDEDGVALVMFDANKTYYDGTLTAGKVLSGQKATYTSYKNQDEIIPTNAVEATDGVAPVPTKLTEKPTDAQVNRYIAYDNVAATLNGKNYYIFSDVQLYGATGALKPTAEGNYNVEGIYIVYNATAPEIIVTALAEAQETAIDNTNVDAKAVKFFENGQLIILKNGVYYNAQGAVVR